MLISFLSGCGGGGGGSSSGGVAAQPSPTPTVQTAPIGSPTPLVSPTTTPLPGTTVTISGTLEFELVPTAANGPLDYNAIVARPIRGATVQALGASDNVLASTTSDALGQYSLDVTQSTSVRIRVLARLQESGPPSWDFAVTDNTSGNAVYVLQGGLSSSGSADSTRDLLADSGWNGSSYASTRAAAPFAILDAAYEALQQVLIADATVALPAAELRWSVNNMPTSGVRANGEIGTSSYVGGEGNMYILGYADNDTDEYDKSVIQHEFAHYLEDAVSRSDSPGGPHRLGDEIDMRLAYGEGFANAFSAIASAQPIYSDSAGPSQSRGFGYSLEDDNFGSPGWFSENSVGKIIYDVADSNNDGDDVLSLGFAPIYQVMTDSAYIQSTAFISIYSLADGLRNLTDSDSGIDALMQSEDVFGTGVYGEGETNDGSGSASYVLPVYQQLSVGATIEVCGNNVDSNNDEITSAMRALRYIRVQIPSSGAYRFEASVSSATGDRDPDMFVYFRGDVVTGFTSGAIDQESGTVSLNPGEHIVEVYDYLNVDGDNGGGNACFDVSVSAA